MLSCRNCQSPLSGKRRVYCSRACQDHWVRAQSHRAVVARMASQLIQCAHCREHFPRPVKRGTPPKYCSGECRRLAWNAKNARRGLLARQAEQSSRQAVPCPNPYCQKPVRPFNTRQYCSKECLYVDSERRKSGEAAGQAAAIFVGQLDACRIWYFKCQDCGGPVVRKWKRPGKYCCCLPCARIRRRATDARRSHKRRAAGPKVLSVHELAVRDGAKCNICGRRVDLTLSGMAKWGPTIDHLIPVSRGGTNDPDNLALAHRHCNVSRSNRNHAQLLLTG